MKRASENTGRLLLCICQLALGIALLFDPLGLTSGIIKVGGVILLILGLLSAIRYFRADPAAAHLEQGLAKALCALAAGLFCLLRTEWFLVTFPLMTMLYGVVILFTGIVRVQWTVDMLRMRMERWYLSGIGAALSLLFAAIILLDPFAWTSFLWTFVAISLIVNGIVDLAAIIFTHVALDQKS